MKLVDFTGGGFIAWLTRPGSAIRMPNQENLINRALYHDQCGETN